MKCPKCNYTSFDYSQVCPKCGKDNSEEQARLKFSPHKPDPPFFLASLIGMAGSETHQAAGSEGGEPFSDNGYGEMGAKDLLIALDDLDGKDTEPDDAPEMPDLSTDEIVFETVDTAEEPLETLEPAEDEILFELEPASEETEAEGGDRDPLDMRDFINDPPGETPIAIEAAEINEEKPVPQPAEATAVANDDGVDLFLADEPEIEEELAHNIDATEIDLTAEDPDSSELFLSLDDLSDTTPGQAPPAQTDLAEEEILFELEEVPETGGEPAKNEMTDQTDFWNSDEPDTQVPGSKPKPTEGEKTVTTSEKSKALEEEVNLFSDMDIEPLDLDLSLDELEKPPNND
jgi:hypothetical protein